MHKAFIWSYNSLLNLPDAAVAVVVAFSPKVASALERDSLPILQRLFKLFGSGGSPCVIPPVLVMMK